MVPRLKDAGGGAMLPTDMQHWPTRLKVTLAGVMAVKADRAPQELWHLVRPGSIRHSQ